MDLTPRMASQIGSLFELGFDIKQVAGVVDVPMSQITSWLDPKSPEYNEELHERVSKARADVINMRLERIQKSGNRDTWQGDAWWLERKFPDLFLSTEEPEQNIDVIPNVQAAAAAALEEFRQKQPEALRARARDTAKGMEIVLEEIERGAKGEKVVWSERARFLRRLLGKEEDLSGLLT